MFGANNVNVRFIYHMETSYLLVPQTWYVIVTYFLKYCNTASEMLFSCDWKSVIKISCKEPIPLETKLPLPYQQLHFLQWTNTLFVNLIHTLMWNNVQSICCKVYDWSMQHYKVCKCYVQATMNSANMIFLLNIKNKVQSGTSFKNTTCYGLS